MQQSRRVEREGEAVPGPQIQGHERRVRRGRGDKELDVQRQALVLVPAQAALQQEERVRAERGGGDGETEIRPVLEGVDAQHRESHGLVRGDAALDRRDGQGDRRVLAQAEDAGELKAVAPGLALVERGDQLVRVGDLLERGQQLTQELIDGGVGEPEVETVGRRLDLGRAHHALEQRGEGRAVLIVRVVRTLDKLPAGQRRGIAVAEPVGGQQHAAVLRPRGGGEEDLAVSEDVQYEGLAALLPDGAEAQREPAELKMNALPVRGDVDDGIVQVEDRDGLGKGEGGAEQQHGQDHGDPFFHSDTPFRIEAWQISEMSPSYHPAARLSTRRAAAGIPKKAGSVSLPAFRMPRHRGRISVAMPPLSKTVTQP